MHPLFIDMAAFYRVILRFLRRVIDPGFLRKKVTANLKGIKLKKLKKGFNEALTHNLQCLRQSPRPIHHRIFLSIYGYKDVSFLFLQYTPDSRCTNRILANVSFDAHQRATTRLVPHATYEKSAKIQIVQS